MGASDATDHAIRAFISKSLPGFPTGKWQTARPARAFPRWLKYLIYAKHEGDMYMALEETLKALADKLETSGTPDQAVDSSKLRRIRHITYVDSRLWLSDEAKIETEQEEDEMDDGTATADLRCFDKTCPQQRHRNVGEIEIKQNAR
jgi:hypothetical protein